MAGKQRKHWASSAAMLAGGLFAMVMPSVVSLLAADAPPAKTQPAASATKPAPKSDAAKKAEEVARVLQFFKDNLPDAYDKALKLRETDPAKFEQLVLPVIPTVNGLDDIKEKNRALYDLKVEDYRLTYQIESLKKDLQRTDLASTEHDKLVVKLKEKVTRQFEVGQGIRQQEISDIQKRVEKLQSQLDEREKDKDNIIKHRVDQLVGKRPATTTPTTDKP